MKPNAQLTEDQTGPAKSEVNGLCMECAMRHHEYGEMLRHEKGTSETAFPRAWIDGRRHILLPRAWTHQETCTECNRKASSLYVRMK
jgi:hypothetical protein